MRAYKKIFLGVWCVLIGFLIFACLIADKYTVPVMMYHNVADSATFREDTVSLANFERQLKFLVSRGYNVITLQELIDGIKSGRKFKHNCVAITFDDGMKNNFTAAYPLLKKYNFAANFFISPGTVGDKDSMTWSDVQTMRANGMTFGSHGMIQAYLPAVSTPEKTYEIYQSKRILEEKLQEQIHFYAYPVGGFNDEAVAMLKQAGYAAAFTTNRGTDRLNKDIYEINRIRFGDKDKSALVLTAKLSGYYNLFRKLKKSH